ncbi:ATP-binding response regulator [Noviherbaspirillum malthae]|uniref:ATP-binding response regulator n=1 Tax=Noviherbaspirillum malthae TaxID=1260987 RepID=UPI00188E311D|nr:ATP-binding protein [Noviherbaspirillum malthae]
MTKQLAAKRYLLEVLVIATLIGMQAVATYAYLAYRQVHDLLTLYLIFQTVWTTGLAGVCALGFVRYREGQLCAEKDLVIKVNDEQLAKARDAIMTKNHFLGTVSHELRTPLQRIVASIDLLDRPDYDKRQRNALDRITSGAAQLDALLHDFLDFSRLDSGKLQLRSGTFNPMEVVRKIVSNYQAAAKNKNMHLVCDLGTSRIEVRSDIFRFQQIVTNLVTNAIKYADKGKIHVTLIYRHDNQSGKTTLGLSVIDEGPGIAPEHQQIIFDPFTQVDQTNTRAKDGAGMGLAIVKRLVEDLFGGRIWVDSELGKGSRFEVRIPVELVSQTPEFNAQAPQALETTRYHQSPKTITGTGKRILLVDDQLAILDLFKDLLEQVGYLCATASNGADAVAMALVNNYDAILLDIHMPGMDGFAVAREIRGQSGPNTGTPIIAVTAHSEYLTSKDQRQVFSNYLLKPVRQDDLTNAIERAVTEESS